MPVDDVLDDGKAEASAADLARAGLFDPEESLRQAVLKLARDALAVVGERDGDMARVGPCAYPYMAALSAVFDGVLEQIARHLRQLIGIAGDSGSMLILARIWPSSTFSSLKLSCCCGCLLT